MFRHFFPEATYRPSPFFSSPFEEDDEDEGLSYFPGYHGYPSSNLRKQREQERQERLFQEKQQRAEEQRLRNLQRQQREEQQRRSSLLQKQKEEEERQRLLLQQFYEKKPLQKQQQKQSQQMQSLQRQNPQRHHKEEQHSQKKPAAQKHKEEEFKKRKEEEQRKKKALSLRYRHAAIIIQRAFRNHLQLRKEAAIIIQRAFRLHLQGKKELSSLILQRTFRRFLAKRQAQPIIEKLRKLQELEQQMEKLRREKERTVFSTPVFTHPGAPLPNKQFLEFEDGVLKLMIKLDGIMSEGSEIVRDRRKAIIAKANKILGSLDRLRSAAKQGMEKEKESEDMDVEED